LRKAAVTATAEQGHDEPEREQYHPPPEIDIDIERATVEVRIAGRAEDGEQCTQDQEQ